VAGGNLQIFEMRISMSKPINYDRPDMYDLLCDRERDDIQFFISRADEIGGPILELACGTGILSIPLAQKGYEVFGIDISEKMLLKARKKAKDMKNINFEIGDMSNYNLGKVFKMIFAGFNCICHLTEWSQIKGFFESTKKHMNKNSRFIIDCFIPNMEYFTRPNDRNYPVFNDDGFIITETNKYDPVKQINNIQWYNEYKGEKWNEYLDLRMFFPQELMNYIDMCGYKIEKYYGDHNSSELNNESRFQIFECSIK
jgi:SAM-dependent methyltransferase